MKQFIHLSLVLAFVSALAAGALALTYGATKEKIAAQEKAAKADALTDIFFQIPIKLGSKEERASSAKNTITLIEGDDSTMSVYEIYAAAENNAPAYYAAEGTGIGYNAGVPIRVLVGFTNPTRDPAPLLKGYVGDEALPQIKDKGAWIVGWRIVKSEETPGLGEKAKDVKPSCTWAEGGIFSGKPPLKDKRTAFQSQFAGRKAPSLKVTKDGGDIDVITASTYTSRGVVKAIRNAAENLNVALAAPTQKTPQTETNSNTQEE